MELNWRRLVDIYTLDELYNLCNLSERSLVHCLDHGYKQVRQIRAALADQEQRAAMDREVREELEGLLGARPPRPEAPPPPGPQHGPTRDRMPRAFGSGVHYWPGIPADIWDLALQHPDLDVRLLLQHLSTRSRNAMLRYLGPEFAVADLDKLVFSDLAFNRFRNIGLRSALELDHWRKQLRQLRAAAQAQATQPPAPPAAAPPAEDPWTTHYRN